MISEKDIIMKPNRPYCVFIKAKRWNERIKKRKHKEFSDEEKNLLGLPPPNQKLKELHGDRMKGVS